MGEMGGRNVLLPLLAKLPSEFKFSLIPAIVVVDALQFVKAVRPLPTLKPAYGGFKMVNVSKRQSSHKGMLSAPAMNVNPYAYWFEDDGT